MKVLFDHQLFSYQRFGGASKYFCELLKNLPINTWETTAIYSNNEYVKDNNLFPCKQFLPSLYFRGQGRIMNELGKIHSIKRINAQNYDLLHVTHYEPYFIKSLKSKPLVVNFFDRNFSTLNYNKRIVEFQKKTFKRADKIITISSNSKKDLMDLFDIPEEKIAVIYLGIENARLDCLPKTKLLEGNYILYVGARGPNKNWWGFIKAYKRIHDEWPSISLVCTGKAFNRNEEKYIYDLGLHGWIHNIAASEQEMRMLYRDAEMFVFPSFYEGFGMPLLEAMACDCPVVCSDASCFPEIAKDAALFFDPYSIDNMYLTINQVLDDPILRGKLVERGREIGREYSWEKCAMEHLQIYSSVLGG